MAEIPFRFCEPSKLRLPDIFGYQLSWSLHGWEENILEPRRWRHLFGLMGSGDYRPPRLGKHSRITGMLDKRSSYHRGAGSGEHEEPGLGHHKGQHPH